jgi:Sulfotransferase family
MTAGAYLNAQEIFDTAARQYGLEPYVEAGIRERFVAMVALFNEVGRIPADALLPALADMKHAVVSRLQIARDWAEHPEILQQEIIRPIFVAGNPRTGSTITQALLSLGDGHRTPRYMEALYPSPPRGLNPRADENARRGADAYVATMLRRDPRLLVSHPYHDRGGLAEAEDEFIYSLNFDMAYPLHFMNVPSVPLSGPPKDAVGALRFHKNMLRHLQWRTPTVRWVGKGFQHPNVLAALFEVYPDAIVVWTHRRPEEYMASLVAVTDFVYRPVGGALYTLTPQQMVAGVRATFDRVLRDPMVNDPRVSHVRFTDMVKDPVAVIAGVYATHGLEFTARYEARLRQRLADPAHRVDRHGKFTYTAAEYGLDVQEMTSVFSDYRTRFGL